MLDKFAVTEVGWRQGRPRASHTGAGPRRWSARPRYASSAGDWGFAIYRVSHDDYQDSFLPTGYAGGAAEDALDTACGLYLLALAWAWLGWHPLAR